jgi:2-keto-3-deoxy-L-rhamnonate aldolase RhmA
MNIALEQLRNGQPLYALGVRFSRTTDIARLAHGAGYHVIWVDLEHSTIALDEAVQICGCAADLGMTPWVRVAERDYGSIGRVLDGGASGIIVPRVEDADQASDAVMATRFPPLGQRSQIAILPQLQFERLPAGETNRRIDAMNTLQVLIETRKGVENADAIAAVDGVDILGVGINDLSADLGCLGEQSHPALQAACEKVIAAARRHGKLPIVGGVADPARYAQLLMLGMAPLIMAGMDGELMQCALRLRIAQERALHP